MKRKRNVTLTCILNKIYEIILNYKVTKYIRKRKRTIGKIQSQLQSLIPSSKFTTRGSTTGA